MQPFLYNPVGAPSSLLWLHAIQVALGIMYMLQNPKQRADYKKLSKVLDWCTTQLHKS